MRYNRSLVRVAAVMAADTSRRFFGYELAKAARVRSWPMYRALNALMKRGWVNGDGWQSPEEADGAAPRRYYTVTRAGQSGLRSILDAGHLNPRLREHITAVQSAIQQQRPL